MTNQTIKSKPDVQRQPNGQLKPGGESLNPRGRPKRAVEEKALTTVAAKLDGATWEKLIDAMVKEAQKGNVAAFNSLRDMYAGKPTERLAVSAEDEGDISLTLPSLSLTDDENSPANGGESDGSQW